MDAQVGNVLLAGSDPALAADQQQDLALYGSDQQHAEQDLQQVAVTAAARAVSYDANADETRFLVDKGRAAEYQDAFLRNHVHR
jgi:hypothetical protein